MNKKLLVVAVAMMSALTVLAHGYRHHGGPSWGPRHQVGYAHYHRGVQVAPNYHVMHGGHHYHSGAAFVGGVVGGVVGAMVAPRTTVVTTPTVVAAPAAVYPVYPASQAVYVNGQQVVSSDGVVTAAPAGVTTVTTSYGVNTTRYQVWIPGHWRNGDPYRGAEWVPGHYETK